MTKTQTPTMPRHGIKITDAEAVAAYINAVNGKATTHTADPALASYAASYGEDMLSKKGVAKARRVGAEFVYVTPAPAAKKYRNAAICSLIRYRRYAEGWRIIDAEKVGRYPGADTGYILYLPTAEIERIKVEAVKTATKGIRSLPKKAA
jgi:hypothetical protein